VGWDGIVDCAPVAERSSDEYVSFWARPVFPERNQKKKTGNRAGTFSFSGHGNSIGTATRHDEDSDSTLAVAGALLIDAEYHIYSTTTWLQLQLHTPLVRRKDTMGDCE
jgi:hypothetical protein